MRSYHNFNVVSAEAYKRGQVLSYTDGDGSVTHVAASGGWSNGRIAKIQRPIDKSVAIYWRVVVGPAFLAR